MTDTVEPVIFTGPSRGLTLQDGDEILTTYSAKLKREVPTGDVLPGRTWMAATINPDPDVHWGDDNFGIWVTEDGEDADRFRAVMRLYGWREVAPAPVTATPEA